MVKESKLVRFYKNKYFLRDEDGKKICIKELIINYENYPDYYSPTVIKWIYPSKSNTEPTLTMEDIKIFRTNKDIRLNVVKLVERLLLFIGFIFSNHYFVRYYWARDTWFPHKTLDTPKFYPMLTGVLKFLNTIHMEFLSTCLFLALCKTTKIDKQFAANISNDNVFSSWIKTQKYLPHPLNIPPDSVWEELPFDGDTIDNPIHYALDEDVRDDSDDTPVIHHLYDTVFDRYAGVDLCEDVIVGERMTKSMRDAERLRKLKKEKEEEDEKERKRKREDAHLTLWGSVD